MCFPLTNFDARSSAFFAKAPDDCIFSPDFGTTRLVYDLTEFRNVAPRRLNFDNLPAIVGKRLVAAEGYAVLALVALVEGVARIAFGLLMLIPAGILALIRDDSSAIFLSVVSTLFMGLVGAPDTILRCGIAFVKNVYRAELSFQDLSLCNTFYCCGD